MLDRLLHALTLSKNQAADDVLVEALRLGTEAEQRPILDAILKRKTVRSLCGAVEAYDGLPEPLQRHLLDNIKTFHQALREAGRSDNTDLRIAALKLIAIGRQGKLAYVLSENLHSSNEALSKTATEAMVALARWISTGTRKLQRGEGSEFGDLSSAAGESGDGAKDKAPAKSASPVQHSPDFLSQRPEIEAAIARALDVHRGRHGPDLLRAALLLCDWPESKTLAILHTTKHGGQSPMVRRLQKPPEAEYVEAFLLGASHGQLRSHFGIVFSHIDEAPVLDALLRKTHWLKDQQLQVCMHQVTRGIWWEGTSLARDIDRRTPDDAARIGEWLGASAVHDVVQDERMERLLHHAAGSFDARLRLLRVAMRRKRGSSINLLKALLTDADERLVRMAARDIVRRRPPDFENALLQLMTGAPASVRRVVSRAIGQTGFEQFWTRFDRLDRITRKQAGKAMLKLLPDGIIRLRRRLSGGSPEQKVKALQIAQELELAGSIRTELVQLCNDPNAHIRSKAVMVTGEVRDVPEAVLVDRLINDPDARVRANAIEVMEAQEQPKLLPVLAQRARSSHNRERANAIKALLRMKVGAASAQLTHMLRDPRPEHRVSALWALRQSGWWHLLNEVGRLAKDDDNLRVRRYAMTVLKTVADAAQARKQQQLKGVG